MRDVIALLRLNYDRVIAARRPARESRLAARVRPAVGARRRRGARARRRGRDRRRATRTSRSSRPRSARGRGPFPVAAADDPGQRGRRHASDGRRVIASLGGSGGYAERVAVPAARCSTSRTASRSTTPSRCSPTAARRRCSPTPRRIAAGRARAGRGRGGRRRHAARPARASRAGATRGRRASAARPSASSSARSAPTRRRATTTVAGAVRRRLRRRRRRRSRATAFALPARRAGGCSPTASPAGSWADVTRRGGRGARRHARAARPRPDALRSYTERALRRGPDAGHRPALPAGKRRRRPRRDRGPRDARQDPAGDLAGWTPVKAYSRSS